jgi:hypothetical protein
MLTTLGTFKAIVKDITDPHPHPALFISGFHDAKKNYFFPKLFAC